MTELYFQTSKNNMLTLFTTPNNGKWLLTTLSYAVLLTLINIRPTIAYYDSEWLQF